MEVKLYYGSVSKIGGNKILHYKMEIKLHWPGIEPGPPAWQARILPLNHQCYLANFLQIRVNNYIYAVIFAHYDKPGASTVRTR